MGELPRPVSLHPGKAHCVVAGWDDVVSAAVRYLIGAGVGVTVIVSAATTATASAGQAGKAVVPFQGARIVRGAPSRRRTLEQADVRTAAALLLSLPAEKVVPVAAAARALNPSIRVVASPRPGDDRPDLWAAGADAALDVREEAGKQLAALALGGGRFDGEQDVRVGILTIGPGSGPVRMRLADLRARLSRVTVACVLSGGSPDAADISDHAVLEIGDQVVVIGGLEALLACGARALDIPHPPPR